MPSNSTYDIFQGNTVYLAMPILWNVLNFDFNSIVSLHIIFFYSFSQ